MKRIYVLMVELPTLANKLVYLLTGFKYSHFSICLDNKLKNLYAFQIRNKNTSLVGGFVKENESFYFHGKKNITLNEMIFEIPVTNKEYYEISKHIRAIEKDKEYIFNYISCLLMFIFGGLKSYKSYHCCEFVSEILNMINNVNFPKKTYKIHPKDLFNVLKKFNYYEKKISSNDYEIDDNIFFKNIKATSTFKKSLYTTTESIIRFIFKRTRKKYDYHNCNFYINDLKSESIKYIASTSD